LDKKSSIDIQQAVLSRFPFLGGFPVNVQMGDIPGLKTTILAGAKAETGHG